MTQWPTQGVPQGAPQQAWGAPQQAPQQAPQGYAPQGPGPGPAGPPSEFSSFDEIYGARIQSGMIPDEPMMPQGHYVWAIVSVDESKPGDHPALDYRLQAVQAGDDVNQQELAQFAQPQDRQVRERMFMRLPRDIKWFLEVFCGQVLQMGDPSQLVLSRELIRATVGRTFMSQYIHVPADKNDPTGRKYGRMPRGKFQAVGQGPAQQAPQQQAPQWGQQGPQAPQAPAPAPAAWPQQQAPQAAPAGPPAGMPPWGAQQ